MSGVQPQPMSVLERLGFGQKTYQVHHALDFRSAQDMARKLAM